MLRSFQGPDFRLCCNGVGMVDNYGAIAWETLLLSMDFAAYMNT
jgi:hypothetical protein